MATVSSPNSETPHDPVTAPTLVDQMRSRLPQIGGVLQQQGALIALIIVISFSFIRYSDTFDTSAIVKLLDFNTQFGLVALGMTFVIMTGGIDLSVGGTAALASVVAALNSSHGFFFALGAAVLVGALVGVVNGFIVARMGLQPFIATLAVLYMVRGIALKLINDAAQVNVDHTSDFDTISGTTVGNGLLNPPLPFTIPLLIVAFLIGMYVLRYTSFGRHILAIGGNAEAARLMGLPVKRTIFSVYILSGALSGLAGVLLTINESSGSATEGNGWELIAIAAVVVGGTLLSGGMGSVFGTLVGVLLLGMIYEILQLENNYSLDHGGGLNLSSFWQNVVRGLFLLVVVLLQSFLQRRQSAKTAT